MPYLKESRKKEWDALVNYIGLFVDHTDLTKGDINYLICEIVCRVILSKENKNYQTISELIDAVHDAEQELRRRILDVYEDKKIDQNGDVESIQKVLAQIV